MDVIFVGKKTAIEAMEILDKSKVVERIIVFA